MTEVAEAAYVLILFVGLACAVRVAAAIYQGILR